MPEHPAAAACTAIAAVSQAEALSKLEIQQHHINRECRYSEVGCESKWRLLEVLEIASENKGTSRSFAGVGGFQKYLLFN